MTWLVLVLGCAMKTTAGEPEGGAEQPSDAPAEAEAAPVEAEAAPAEGAAGEGEETERVGVAVLEPKSDSETTGTVTFRERPMPDGTDGEAAQAGAGEIAVTIELVAAPPGDHAVHVHEKGDCSAPDASSAGGHFNPAGHAHGRPDAPLAEKHPGDLGNVTVGEDGTGKQELTIRSATLGEGEVSIDGLAVVVHEKADQFTQPTGDAGGRIACGIIKVAPAE